MERGGRGRAALRAALVQEMRRLAEGRSHEPVPDGIGVEFTRSSRIVGLSESTTCYVSPAYFAKDDPFADFVVHEAAHIFHNCKRHTIGLREAPQGVAA